MRDRLVERFGAEVELAAGRTGAFEVTVDGRLAFSKRARGRFPEDAEIDAMA